MKSLVHQIREHDQARFVKHCIRNAGGRISRSDLLRAVYSRMGPDGLSSAIDTLVGTREVIAETEGRTTYYTIVDGPDTAQYETPLRLAWSADVRCSLCRYRIKCEANNPSGLAQVVQQVAERHYCTLGEA